MASLVGMTFLRRTLPLWPIDGRIWPLFQAAQCLALASVTFKRAISMIPYASAASVRAPPLLANRNRVEQDRKAGCWS
jgi:predicted lysophospholipase L1 biosynthesis ABC-type transport system permease subunit